MGKIFISIDLNAIRLTADMLSGVRSRLALDYAETALTLYNYNKLRHAELYSDGVITKCGDGGRKRTQLDVTQAVDTIASVAIGDYSAVFLICGAVDSAPLINKLKEMGIFVILGTQTPVNSAADCNYIIERQEILCKNLTKMGAKSQNSANITEKVQVIDNNSVRDSNAINAKNICQSNADSAGKNLVTAEKTECSRENIGIMPRLIQENGAYVSDKIAYDAVNHKSTDYNRCRSPLRDSDKSDGYIEKTENIAIDSISDFTDITRIHNSGSTADTDYLSTIKEIDEANKRIDEILKKLNKKLAV